MGQAPSSDSGPYVCLHNLLRAHEHWLYLSRHKREDVKLDATEPKSNDLVVYWSANGDRNTMRRNGHFQFWRIRWVCQKSYEPLCSLWEGKGNPPLRETVSIIRGWKKATL